MYMMYCSPVCVLVSSTPGTAASTYPALHNSCSMTAIHMAQPTALETIFRHLHTASMAAAHRRLAPSITLISGSFCAALLVTGSPL